MAKELLELKRWLNGFTADDSHMVWVDAGDNLVLGDSSNPANTLGVFPLGGPLAAPSAAAEAKSSSKDKDAKKEPVAAEGGKK
jgi:hypothetical protein